MTFSHEFNINLFTKLERDTDKGVVIKVLLNTPYGSLTFFLRFDAHLRELYKSFISFRLI